MIDLLIQQFIAVAIYLRTTWIVNIYVDVGTSDIFSGGIKFTGNVEVPYAGE